MRFANDYTKNVFPFPQDDIDPKLKLNPEWLLEAAKAVYGKFLNDQTGFLYSEQEKFDRQRRYGQGRQDIDKYKTQWKPTEGADDRNAKGYVNLDFKIFSPAQKFKAMMRYSMTSMQTEPQVRAVDEASGGEKEEKKFTAWFYSVYGKLVDSIESVTKMKQKKPDFIPSSLEELEVFSEINGFKIKGEIAYNRALKYTDVVSDFSEIERKLQDDLIDIKACVVKDYVDWEDGVVKLKYIDPGRFVADYSLNHGFSKSRYYGHFEDYTISEIRHLCPNMTEESLKDLARQYGGYGSNPASNRWDYYDVQYDNYRWGYDDYKITVFEGEYLSVDTKYRTKSTNQYGTSRYYDDDYGKVRNTSTKETVKRSVRNWYRFKWILHTDYIFDYGKQYDVPRPKKSKPRASYHAYRVPGKSFIETIEPNLDQIQNMWLKLQAAWAAAAPDGLAIEWGALENIVMGGKEQEPVEMLRIRMQTGNLIYRGTNHRGNINITQAKPIQELTGGLGKMAVDAVNSIEFQLNMIAESTGLDRFSAGILPSGETSATASANANRGSNEIIQDMVHGINKVRESAAMNTSHRIALRVKHSKEDYNIYHSAIGHNVGILKISADMTPMQMGIYMKVKPDREAVQRITAAAQAALTGTEGAPGIQLPDYLQIERSIEEGNLTYAEALLSYKIRKNEERAEASKKESIDRQNAGLQRIKESEQQGAMAKIEAEANLVKVQQSEKTKGELALEDRKHENKMKEIRLTLTLTDDNSRRDASRQSGT